MILDKQRRTDQETINLAKQYAAKLKKESGGNYSQNTAIKIALKKVLLK